MRAFAVRSFGEPAAVQDLPIPAADGAVLIRVRFAGVNPLDSNLLGRLTAASAYPFVVGIDFAGVAERVPAGDHGLRAGDRVFGMARTHGSYAEYTAVAPAARMEPLARIPDGVADDQAAALPIPAVTALRTVDLLEVTAGQHVVVMGATGGVGGYAVQMARSRGAQHDTGNRIARIGRIRDGFSTPGVFLRTCSSCAATSAGSNVSCAKEVEALPGISGQATAIQLDSRAARPSTVMSGWTSSFSTRGTG